jgi:hypothetical protein
MAYTYLRTLEGVHQMYTMKYFFTYKKMGVYESERETKASVCSRILYKQPEMCVDCKFASDTLRNKCKERKKLYVT